jgi:hypothetical protein
MRSRSNQTGGSAVTILDGLLKPLTTGEPPLNGEIWRDIPGYEGAYQVSSCGRVRSLDRRVLCSDGDVHMYKGPVLRPSLGRADYSIVTIGRRTHGRRKTRYLHELILTAFAEPRPFPKAVARHLDGDKTNNAVNNLRWGTHKENCEDRDRHGRGQHGSQNPRAKLTEAAVCEIRRLHYLVPHRELARRYRVSPSAVAHIHCRRSWTRV